MNTGAHRSVLLAGATGLVGAELLRALLADDSVTHVLAIGRRAPKSRHPKVDFQAVDFSAMPSLPPADECYIALGTTIKAAGSQAAFRAIDFDAVVNVARAAKAAGAKRIGVVSAMGADPRSNVFYSRVKGEMENALASLDFDTLAIARPSMLTGDRSAVGQPARRGEQIALRLSRKLAWVIPANYRSITAASVARGLLHGVAQSNGQRVMLSGELRTY
jgi:uncharacterized protein YbjT (DUF2867 family)